ncbi:MAG: hypothetical protein ACRBFS_21760 [Aureispira sp.]
MNLKNETPQEPSNALSVTFVEYLYNVIPAKHTGKLCDLIFDGNAYFFGRRKKDPRTMLVVELQKLFDLLENEDFFLEMWKKFELGHNAITITELLNFLHENELWYKVIDDNYWGNGSHWKTLTS